MEFTFTTEHTLKRADEVVDYLRGPRLWVPRVEYPDFDRWAEKLHSQLKTEEKRAVLALSSGVLVGAVIYQRHRAEAHALEVKNLTVRPDVRGRLVASFLLRNAEVEGCRDFGCHEIVVDAKARNVAIRAFLLHSGYCPADVADLYGLGAGADIIYRKTASSRAFSPGFAPA